VTAITHRHDAVFQALLTAIGGEWPPTENDILKQLSYEASFLERMREQFPTLSSVAVPSSGGVAFRIVMAMKAALRRRGARRPFSRHDRQHAAQDRDRGRSRHRRATQRHWARAGRPHEKEAPAPSACSRRAT
jgi:hypothetical protein